jgi:hypothetical protein
MLSRSGSTGWKNVLTTMTVAERSCASANAKRTAASLCGRPSQPTTTLCRTSTPGGGAPLSGPPPRALVVRWHGAF